MKNLLKLLTIITCLFGSVENGFSAPKAELWDTWLAHDPESVTSVDHTMWDNLLKKYIVIDPQNGINLLQYGQVGAEDKNALNLYLKKLQSIPVSKLNRLEQKAYWINLYNALTVKVILDHYPVKSIRNIDISPGFLSDGPWDKKLVSIENEHISLNDIEHRILRPIWQDNRVHYAVNCASLGCPNLQPLAYTSTNIEALLIKGAKEYINHPRGAKIQGNKLTLSSIYNWFQEDFGRSKADLIQHLLQYSNNDLAAGLENFSGKIKYKYDWTLNE